MGAGEIQARIAAVVGLGAALIALVMGAIVAATGSPLGPYDALVCSDYTSLHRAVSGLEEDEYWEQNCEVPHAVFLATNNT